MRASKRVELNFEQLTCLIKALEKDKLIVSSIPFAVTLVGVGTGLIAAAFYHITSHPSVSTISPLLLGFGAFMGYLGGLIINYVRLLGGAGFPAVEQIFADLSPGDRAQLFNLLENYPHLVSPFVHSHRYSILMSIGKARRSNDE